MPAATLAAPAQVTGTLNTAEPVTLGADAVAVITLVDQQAAPSAGVIIGQQRIDGVTLPADFSVDYDDVDVDPTHSYALFASVVDGDTSYQSVEPIPVITGGPTADVAVHARAALGRRDGRRSPARRRARPRSALTPDAVSIVALINQDKGTLVARQVIPDDHGGAHPVLDRLRPGDHRPRGDVRGARRSRGQ